MNFSLNSTGLLPSQQSFFDSKHLRGHIFDTLQCDVYVDANSSAIDNRETVSRNATT